MEGRTAGGRSVNLSRAGTLPAKHGVAVARMSAVPSPTSSCAACTHRRRSTDISPRSLRHTFIQHPIAVRIVHRLSYEKQKYTWR